MVGLAKVWLYFIDLFLLKTYQDYECSKMINNMAGYVYFSYKMARKREKLSFYIISFNFLEFEKAS